MVETNKILRDHKKVGQRLITPLNQFMASKLNEVSWSNRTLPELLWIGLMQRHLGPGPGVKLITSIGRAARAIHPGPEHRLFATISNFSILAEPQKRQLKADLERSGELGIIQDCLDPLVSWYPDCPLNLFFSQAHAAPTDDKLQYLKRLVSSLLSDRTDREPTLVKATAVWLGFDADFIKVQQGSIISQFPEVERYPETEISRKVAAAIGAMVNMLFAADTQYLMESPWPEYFWNRGIEIDNCEF
jgi:hypothetical protein